MALDVKTVGGRPTITVNSTAEVSEAHEYLSRQKGGGTILLEDAAKPYAIEIKAGAKTGKNAVRIESAEDDAPTHIHRVALTQIENVHVDNVFVNSEGVDRRGFHRDITLHDTKNIKITDSSFENVATGLYDPREKGSVLAEILGRVRGSEDVTFEGNTVKGYYHGLSFQENKNLRVANNDISEMQGDGLRFAGAQNVVIENNYLHDFHGTTQNFNHNDMIQFWSTNAKLNTKDVVIRGNTIDSGEGGASQSIFVNNEKYGRKKGPAYENIEITDNLVYNGQGNGISVFGAKGVEVSDNTVLWNKGSRIQLTSDDEGFSTAPRILLRGVRDGEVSNNITTKVVDDGRNDVKGNRIVDYNDPSDPAYVDNQFVNVSVGGDVGLSGLRLRADSDWVGTGAAQAQPVDHKGAGASAVAVYSDVPGDSFGIALDASWTVDQGGRVDPDDYRFEWVFQDGTVKRGVEIDHSFEERGEQTVLLNVYDGRNLVDTFERDIMIAAKGYVALDFEDGIADSSTYDSSLKHDSARRLVRTDDGKGYHIDGRNRLEIARDNKQIHSLNSFALSTEIELKDADDTGRFLHFRNVFDANVTKDGSIEFTLITNRGTYQLDSGKTTFRDGREHDFAVVYDGGDNELSMLIDGKTVDSVEAAGVTKGKSHYGLVLGEAWNKSVNAVLDDFKFGADAGAIDLAGKVSGKQSLVKAETDKAAAKKPAVEKEVEKQAERPVEKPAEKQIEKQVGDTDAAVRLDFDRNVRDVSGNEVKILDAAKVDLVRSDDGQGLRIGTGDSVTVARGTDAIHELDEFALSIDIRLLGEADRGEFLHLNKVFKGGVDRDGSVDFTLTTDRGTFRVDSEELSIRDDEFHNIAIVYDGDAGELALLIDSEIVDTARASGETADQSHWGLTLGDRWSGAVDAVIDDFAFAPEADALGFGLS